MKKKTVNTPTGPVDLVITDMSQNDAKDVINIVRDLTTEESAAINGAASRMIDLFETYFEDPNAITIESDMYPVALDYAFAQWLFEDDPNKPTDEFVVSTIGAALGNHLVASLGAKWVHVQDQWGNSFAIQMQANESTQYVYPHDLVAKRVMSQEIEFINAVKLALIDQIGET